MPQHGHILLGFGVVFLLMMLWALTQAWLHQAKTETIHPLKAYVHLLAFYLSYLLWPLMLFNVYASYSQYYSLHQSVFIHSLTLILIYARFVEPHRLRVQQHRHRLNPDAALNRAVKVVLIADLHVGLFSGHERQLKRIAQKINQIKPDFVLVSGDWTYEPEQQLAHDLRHLKTIEALVYSVPGNHDEQYPGPPIQALLQQALEVNNVIDIEGQIVEFEEFRLIGIGDLWAGKADMRFMPDLPQDKPWLVLSHNPDTVDMVPQLPTRPLMLSGHTHGGQIELPWITDYILKRVSILGHKQGFYHHQYADVFVTVGTGMVGIPFRFRVPPTIDVIELI